MSLSWQKKIILFVLVGLLAGCTAINKLLEEPFTGPSWDLSIDGIPLVPPQTLTAKELVGDLLGDEQTEGEPLAIKIDLGDIFNLEMDMVDIPPFQIAGEDIPLLGNPGDPYNDKIADAEIEIDLNGLNWVKFASGHIEIILENKTDSPINKLAIKLIDSNGVPIIAEEITDLGVDETKALYLSLADKQLPKEFDLELWLETAVLGSGSISFDATVGDLDWAEVAIDINNSDFDLTIPGDVIETGLDEIGEMLQGTTIHSDAIEFNLTVSNPTNTDLNINLPAVALDSAGNILASSNISFLIEGGARDKQVSILGLGELINKFPHSIRFTETNLFADVNEVIVYNNFDFTIAMDIKVSAILSISPGGTTFRLDSEVVDLSSELGNFAGSWIREAALQFDVTNHFPLGLQATVFMSNEADPYNDANGYSTQFLLPETLTDDDGKVLSEASESREIRIDSEFLRILQEPFYLGIEIDILNTQAGDKTAAFYLDDWVKISLWGEIGIRINPQDS